MPPRRPTTGRGSADRPAPRATARPGTPRTARPAASRAAESRAPAQRTASTRPATTRAPSARPPRRQPLARPATVLTGVLVVLALLITPQLRDWWVQQRTLAAMRQDLASSQREVQALRAERARWQDPDYVKAQARERLHFVMPGETGFAVTGGGAVQKGGGTGPAAGPPGSAPKRPWYGTLWSSVQAAGDPGVPQGRLTDQQLIDRQPTTAVPPDEVLVDQGQP